jgi:anion-transporting  ArsA/GET3 family ATPase
MPPRTILYTGKGGVGKTSVAAATARRCAAAGLRTIVLSTDPAHSLSDSLGCEVGDRTFEVARKGKREDAPRLFAREMDAARALEEFKTKHRAVLAEIADRGTILDEADINDLLDLSLPGMDEVMALFELSEVERAGVYSRVVVDTAPSGHTSRLLRLPEVFSRMVAALARRGADVELAPGLKSRQDRQAYGTALGDHRRLLLVEDRRDRALHQRQTHNAANEQVDGSHRKFRRGSHPRSIESPLDRYSSAWQVPTGDDTDPIWPCLAPRCKLLRDIRRGGAATRHRRRSCHDDSFNEG